jgi:hypothetical protein
MEEVILKRFLHCVLAQDVDKAEEEVLAAILAPNFMMGQLRLMGRCLIVGQSRDGFVFRVTDADEQAVLDDVVRGEELGVRDDLLVDSKIDNELLLFVFVGDVEGAGGVVDQVDIFESHVFRELQDTDGFFLILDNETFTRVCLL